MSNLSTAKIRRIVLTGSIAAITATGAWYGAGLKVQQERNEVGKSIVLNSLDRTDPLSGQTSNIGGFRRRKAEANGNATRPAGSPERRAADQNRSANQWHGSGQYATPRAVGLWLWRHLILQVVLLLRH